ncbi:MAG: response regulator [Bacteroidetes bacterium]|jgi:two-component system OmpR family response regulator|nr:response regulator [Bacteroidota bacterium]MBK9318539.1 response regulator [Bacteroidota bacterium]MBL0098199.1 response regulator [Bacteroidota bacterium]
MAQKTLIYIVDDEPMQRELLKDNLEKMPAYEIHAFPTGEECLAASQVRIPSIVFLDYNLNSQVRDAMDGIDILKELKKISAEIEVVMISGQDQIEVAVNTMKYGAFDYIVKGEGAFLRAEKTVFNIYRYHKMAGDASRYKKLMIFFGVGMLIMIAVVVILQTKGLIRSSPSWY